MKFTELITRILTYCFVWLLLLSCKKENSRDCFKSTGKEITEIRYPGIFKSIEINDKMDVTIYQGAEHKVEISAGKNLMSNITSKVTNGILKLDNINKCNFVRGYKRKIRVKITTPYIEEMSHIGLGPVSFDENYKQDKIFIKAGNSGDVYLKGTYDEVRTSSHGNGDIYMSGNTKTLLIYTNGTNYIRAEDFRVSNYLYISSYSIGDAYFNLEGLNKMEYLIWSEGNIYYKGNPQVINDLSKEPAAGRIIQQE